MKERPNRISTEENSLAEGFVNNDRKCVATIYRENYKSVEQYVLKNNGSTAQAKDIYQEAVTAAWLNGREGKFKPGSDEALGGYIYQIAKFKWLDKLKSKQYKSTMRLVHDDVQSEDTELDYKLEQEQRMVYLEGLYTALDAKCKSILNRFYYEKKSLETIGKELKYDAATIKTLKYRCMKKLKTLHNSRHKVKKK